MKLRILKKILTMWFDEAMFGSGFFHSDLHLGNIFFNSIKSQGVLSEYRVYETTLLDYGSAATLSKTQSKGFLKFVLGVFLMDEDSVFSGLGSFVDAESDIECCYEAIKKIMSDDRLSTGKKTPNLYCLNQRQRPSATYIHL